MAGLDARLSADVGLLVLPGTGPSRVSVSPHGATATWQRLSPRHMPQGPDHAGGQPLVPRGCEDECQA